MSNAKILLSVNFEILSWEKPPAEVRKRTGLRSPFVVRLRFPNSKGWLVTLASDNIAVLAQKAFSGASLWACLWGGVKWNHGEISECVRPVGGLTPYRLLGGGSGYRLLPLWGPCSLEYALSTLHPLWQPLGSSLERSRLCPGIFCLVALEPSLNKLISFSLQWNEAFRSLKISVSLVFFKLLECSVTFLCSAPVALFRTCRNMFQVALMLPKSRAQRPGQFRSFECNCGTDELLPSPPSWWQRNLCRRCSGWEQGGGWLSHHAS